MKDTTDYTSHIGTYHCIMDQRITGSRACSRARGSPSAAERRIWSWITWYAPVTWRRGLNWDRRRSSGTMFAASMRAMAPLITVIVCLVVRTTLAALPPAATETQTLTRRLRAVIVRGYNMYWRPRTGSFVASTISSQTTEDRVWPSTSQYAATKVLDLICDTVAWHGDCRLVICFSRRKFPISSVVQYLRKNNAIVRQEQEIDGNPLNYSLSWCWS